MKNDDAQLIQRVLAGDDTAFSVLVKRYQKPVHALAWRKIGDFHVAEEITQDTFLKAYQRLSTLKEPQRFVSWLYVIATNHCNAWLRKKRLRTEPLEDISSEALEKATYSGYVIEENERTAIEAQREVVKKLLAKLQESERTILTLHYFGEMSSSEIGAFLGVSASTVRSRLRRAQQRLKKEEPMIREALEHFQITPNFTENIMREIPRLKPVVPSGSKPIVPWAIGISTLAVVLLMLGIGNQYMSRFQKPYSFEATSEMTVEIIEAPVVLNLEFKPDVRTQLGNINALNSSNGLNQQPDPPEYMARFAAASVDETEAQVAPMGGTIIGNIKDTTLLELPMSGVRVVFVSTEGAEFETQSDKDGHFEHSGLPAGQYVVNIYKRGYEDRLGKPVSVIDDGRHHVPLTMNKLKNPDDDSNRDGVLRFWAYNRTKSGGPMEGLKIAITGTVGLDLPRITGISGIHGQYLSDKLPPGTYIVTLIKNDYHVVCPMTVHADKITDAHIQFPIQDKNIDANTPQAQQSNWSSAKNVLHGRILEMNPARNVLSDVKVVIESQSGLVFNDTSNADGEYECRGLSAGRYLINLHKEGYIEKKGIPLIVTNNGNHSIGVIEEGMFVSYAVVADGSIFRLTHGMRKQ